MFGEVFWKIKFSWNHTYKWVISFLGKVLLSLKVYIKVSKKSFEKSIGGMTDVNIPFWSWSIIFFEKNISRSKKSFSSIFSDSKVEKIDFKRFKENHDFSQKTMLLSSNRGCKINYFWKIIFQTFLFLENLQNGFLTFLISAFNQKLHRETYTQFSDFHHFWGLAECLMVRRRTFGNR